MSIAIVPHLNTDGVMELWSGSMDPALLGSQITARVGPATFALQPLQRVFEDAVAPLVSRTTLEADLDPGREYEIFARIGNAPEERAGHLRAPAVALGDRSEPFRVLLASCNSRLGDNARRAAPLLAYLNSKQSLRPHLKIWCGDQIYLDSPASHYIFNRHSEPELQERHSEHYAATWFGSDGLGASFREGLNVFCPDDHELWNNAPFPTLIASDTWFSDGHRRAWRRVAGKLYAGFQNPTTAPVKFKIGPLSFCIADLRMDRDDARRDLMSGTSLNSIEDWIAGLSGPGVLAIGQLLFAKPSGVLAGKFGDYDLQNYDQFAQLAAAINGSQQSIAVLTGDVHYSRVASTRLPSQKTLAEVISSPLSLVKGAGGKWQAAPERVKTNGTVLGGKIETDAQIQTSQESVALLEFFTAGASIALRVQIWPVLPANGTYGSMQETEILL
ncbi:MAG TPA: hypothetical protein VH814_12410 [Steroidobacteraceae bacterium]|jgi:hypothetical protein